MQERREGRLAVKLAAILEGYASGAEDEFKTTMTAMAAQLVQVSYGEMMLHLIGFMYEKQALEFMTDPVAGMGTWADLGVRSHMVGMLQCSAVQCNAVPCNATQYNTIRCMPLEKTPNASLDFKALVSLVTQPTTRPADPVVEIFLPTVAFQNSWRRRSLTRGAVGAKGEATVDADGGGERGVQGVQRLSRGGGGGEGQRERGGGERGSHEAPEGHASPLPGGKEAYTHFFLFEPSPQPSLLVLATLTAAVTRACIDVFTLVFSSPSL